MTMMARRRDRYFVLASIGVGLGVLHTGRQLDGRVPRATCRRWLVVVDERSCSFSERVIIQEASLVFPDQFMASSLHDLYRRFHRIGFGRRGSSPLLGRYRRKVCKGVDLLLVSYSFFVRIVHI